MGQARNVKQFLHLRTALGKIALAAGKNVSAAFSTKLLWAGGGLVSWLVARTTCYRLLLGHWVPPQKTLV